MLDFLSDLFNKNEDSTEKTSFNRNHKMQIAACALFLEIANIDENFTDKEKQKIICIMKNSFQISDSEIEQLFYRSKEEIERSVSDFEFTSIVNQHLDNNEKYSLIKNLWQIAYTDGNLDKYEDHFIKKICNNLNLSNKDRIAAKLEVKEELGI